MKQLLLYVTVLTIAGSVHPAISNDVSIAEFQGDIHTKVLLFRLVGSQISAVFSEIRSTSFRVIKIFADDTNLNTNGASTDYSFKTSLRYTLASNPSRSNYGIFKKYHSIVHANQWQLWVIYQFSHFLVRILFEPVNLSLPERVKMLVAEQLYN